MYTDVLARAEYRYSTITERRQSERVRQVIRSGILGTIGGTEVALLEQRVASMLGRAGALAVSSATAGLELVLRCLGIGPGDEVIIPELAWVSVGGVVWAVGAEPVVAPVGETLMLTWDDVEPLIGPRTRVVIVAHMRGMAAVNLSTISVGLHRSGISLIEDCAQAWGVRDADGHVGRHGLAAVFSIQTHKLIATGEGGIVSTDDEVLLSAMRALSGDTRARTPEPSWRLNHRMGEIQAAMAMPQLEGLDELVNRLVPLQHEMARVFADSPTIRDVVPRPDGRRSRTNGSRVGLWFGDGGSAAVAAAFLSRSGIPCYQPGAEGDLHAATSWPVSARRPLVDLRRYADVAVPVVDASDRDDFLARLREVVARLADAMTVETGR